MKNHTAQNSENQDVTEIDVDVNEIDLWYYLSVNYEGNDWNDPLNDHWDNY